MPDKESAPQAATSENQDRHLAGGLVTYLNGMLVKCKTEELKTIIATTIENLQTFQNRLPLKDSEA